MKTVTVIGVHEWHRLPRRLRRRYTAHLGLRWGITDLNSVRCLFVINDRVAGAELYLRDAAGRLILNGHDVATLRVGRSHG